MALNDRDSDRDRALDQAYGAAARDEPPAHLDAAILAAAHREAGSRPRTPVSTLRHWRVPASLAAVVVVSVSLVTLMREEGGDRLMQPDVPPSSRSEPPVTPPTPQAPDSQVSPHPDATAGKKPMGERDDRPPVEPASGSPPAAETAAKMAGKAVAQPEADSQTHTTERALAKQRAQEGAASADRNASPRGELGAVAKPSDGPLPSREASPSTPARPTIESEMRDRAMREEAPAAGSAVPDTPRAAPAPAPSTTTQAEPRLQRRSGDPITPELARLLKEHDALPPRDWIDRIRELRRAGQTVLAEGMLTEFRRRFPDQPVPAERQ
jgi:hypothetical protein